MKRYILGLVVFTMLLLTPAVSFGSDGSPTENPDVVMVDDYDYSVTADIIATTDANSALSTDRRVVTEGNDYITITAYALHSKSAIDATIIALTNRARWLKTDKNNHNFNSYAHATNPGKIRKNPSNHVGKFMHRTTNK